MPPRLAHRKSRRGCLRCKERKVKCTEEHPSCAACLRHGVACEYGDTSRTSAVHEGTTSGTSLGTQRSRTVSRTTSELLQPTTTGQTANKSSSTGPPSGLDSPYSEVVDSLIADPLRPQIDLYLLHRFKSSVAASFPSAQSPLLKNMYVWSAVEESFDHPYLMNAIFAITALYLWVHDTFQMTSPPTHAATNLPESLKSVNFARLHRVYLNLAIGQEREALSAISPDNADSLGMTCVLLSVMSICLLSGTHLDDEGLAEYTPPIQWLTMAKGNEAVFIAAVPHLREGAIMNYLRTSSEPNFRDHSRLFDPHNALPFTKILDFRRQGCDYDWQTDSEPTNREAYAKTMALVGAMYDAVRAGEPSHYICMRCVSFATMVPRPFVALLASKTPRALVAIAHALVFLKYSDDYWFFRGRAEKELAGIRMTVPDDWQWALRWPLAVLADKENIKLDPRDYYDDWRANKMTETMADDLAHQFPL
ncbi:hypothetical protein EDD37DRAFT_133203 [Exophiala viscosa]|uniref:Zn(2)-C6 fungal-type domain-containing protein n=1 Tax=Exophiala viscosa TaxID=2486360 RepID=A0AAN6DM25_9EURO|nr:hypothetical protein EDD36DRAFT_80727 [Exophiala viscosa]KAI1620793.1 hypothetical protein EDD37DRAFT_133203 [Exophiala viscosa]